ncbi:MAG: hypothetical protein ACR2MX_11185 [Cyclobacteriaceae bacterium]
MAVNKYLDQKCSERFQILLFSILLLPALSNLSMAQENARLSEEQLSQKWILDKYQFLLYTEAPARKEKGDYLQLNSDLTFISVSEGKSDGGSWQLNKSSKSISLSSHNESGDLVFIIDSISKNQLILIINDPSDPEAKYLKIIFRAQHN